MADDDNLCINISLHGQWNSERPQKRNAMSKKEWIHHKREKKRALQDEGPSSQSTAKYEEKAAPTPDPAPPPPVSNTLPKPNKTKTPSAPRQRHPENKATTSKFSALFTKNPDIPSLKSTAVRPMTEKVFTGDSFKDLDLHTFMVDNLEKKLGFSEMTAVQKATIPHIMQGRDVLIQSQTGSGKTLAYAVPIVQQLQSRSPRISRANGTFAIVIVPTRELAIQSCTTFTELTRPFTWVVPGSLIGGEKRKAQKARLRKGINIVVTTPGRLLDHLKHTESLMPDRISWLVIDEADRLLDMGFEKEVREIIACLDEKQTHHRQTILLSATLSAGVEQLAGMSLNEPLRISVSQGSAEVSSINTDVNAETKPSKDELASVTSKKVDTPQANGAQSAASQETAKSFATPSSLEHQCVVVPSKLRLVTLAAFLLSKCKFTKRPCKMIVFFSTQDLVEFHHKVFTKCLREEIEDDVAEQASEDEEESWLYKLHGDMEQKIRTKVFQDFQETKSGVLLCTDVAARGLDLPNVEWIVQFQPPTSSSDYIHRAGRTARAGSKGQALLFLTPAEVDFVKVLNEQNISLTTVDMQQFLDTLQRNVIRLLGTTLPKNQIPRSTEHCAIALQKKMETYVDGQSDTRTLARKAYQSFVRAYATYPAALRHIFNLKNVHLGHVAKSFCLAEAPTAIGAMMGTHGAKPKKHKRSALFEEDNVPRKKAKFSHRNTSEFGSGLDGVSGRAMPRKFKMGTQKKKIKIR